MLSCELLTAHVRLLVYSDRLPTNPHISGGSTGMFKAKRCTLDSVFEHVAFTGLEAAVVASKLCSWCFGRGMFVEASGVSTEASGTFGKLNLSESSDAHSCTSHCSWRKNAS